MTVWLIYDATMEAVRGVYSTEKLADDAAAALARHDYVSLDIEEWELDHPEPSTGYQRVAFMIGPLEEEPK